jgi:hypothetical protein
MNRKILSLLLSFQLLVFQHTVANGFLKVQDKLIVNEQGNEVILRGMGLGGWMLQEGYMLQIYRNGTQHSIMARITELIGEEGCKKFYDEWLANHVTRADIDSLAKWGFNSVRLPMHYNLFTLPIEKEPIEGENTWLPVGFALTDSLLQWCKENKLYLILDLHAAPGGQGKDANISDYDTLKPSLWESDLNKRKTIALWRKLAERYANEPWIGGYDLINEPNWTFENSHKNGCNDTVNKPIWDLYIDITRAIREVDKNHIIYIEGNCWAGNYNGFPGPWDNNMVISFHKYWNPNNVGEIQKFIDMREKYNIPLWMGESGENSNQWFVESIKLFEDNKIGWAWWPLKKIGNIVGPLKIERPEGYQVLLDYWQKGGEKPSAEFAKKVLFQVTENLKVQNCWFTKDVIDAMFRQRTENTAIPYKMHTLPCRVYAVDYNMGQQGTAYFDNDYQNIEGPGRGRWNRGGAYRNDGVDIHACNDEAMHTNGYSVFHIEDHEWMTYTVFNEKAETYNLVARVASPVTKGAFQIECNGKRLIDLVHIPETGGEQNWITINLESVDIPAGKNVIKITAVNGGFRLNYLEFTK